MNRIRGAYVELDAGVAPILMASPHDDLEGMMRTYWFFGAPRTSHVYASSGFFLMVITAVLVALLGGAVGSVVGLGIALSCFVGLLAAVLTVTGMALSAFRQFRSIRDTHEPLYPTPVG